MSSDAPALQEADEAFLVPPIDHPDYIDQLLGLCQRHQVGLLMSVNDLELPILSRHRQRFADVDTFPLVSSPAVVDVCFDKWQTTNWLAGMGLPTPKTFLSLAAAQRAIQTGDLVFPVVVKPRWGTASLGVEYPLNEHELELTHQLVQQKVMRSKLGEISRTDPGQAILIQETITGQEYGLDVVNDLHGRYVSTFVKCKLSHSMRPDGVGHAVTVKSEQLEQLGESIARRLGHIGNLDCDVFIRDGRSYILDLNPRFGGGYPFSHQAGANLPAAFLAWVNGEQPDASWLKVKPGIRSARYDDIVIIQTCQTA